MKNEEWVMIKHFSLFIFSFSFKKIGRRSLDIVHSYK